MTVQNPLIIALDVSTREKAISLVKQLNDRVAMFKVGPVLFTRYGPDIIADIKQSGADVFLDLKFHDIPNTVASSVKAIAELGVSMFTVHISGGRDMLLAAVDALKPNNEYRVTRPKILGVTVLTSIAGATGEEVVGLAKVARDCGLDGVIASPLEIEPIRKATGRDFLIVTPGIRPEGISAGDQKRTATPAEALQRGADYIVVGRPIIKSSQPKEAARRILNGIN